MRAGALLLGAGRGDRLGGDLPKAFTSLGDRPLLACALDSVDACPEIEAVVVAAPEGWEERASEIARRSPKVVAVIAGGDTRQASAARALGALPPQFDAVVCHDVARPLAGPELFSAVLAGIHDADGVVPAVAVPDTVKRVDEGRVTETLSRDGLVLVQTPQAFRRGPLEWAHQAAGADGFEATDDAALLERTGFHVAVVQGDPTNVKITGPDDLRLAALLAAHG